ncbi:unnamed protein product [Blepharisma stoltei]|uniref:Uncharacterized protein n=1 Tax=Blepharisma stoltei TaxID=1481888 RepID=A0AAU9J2F1_9CILI|nr:unnamed protein product [Blepharisma stoltei]
MSYFPSRKQTPHSNSYHKRNQSYVAPSEEETKIYKTQDPTHPASLNSSLILEHQTSPLKKVWRLINHRRSKSVDKNQPPEKLFSESDGNIRVTMTATEKYYLNIINTQKLEIQKLNKELEVKGQEIEKLKRENQDLKLQKPHNKAGKISSDPAIYPRNPAFNQKIIRVKNSLFR